MKKDYKSSVFVVLAVFLVLIIATGVSASSPSCEDTFQPSAGLNDGTDDGSEFKGKDTRIYYHVAQEANTNYGSLDKLMFVYYSGYEGYPLLKFNVSTLPSNIDSVKLYLYANPSLDTGCCVEDLCPSMSWAVNRITSDWNEMTVTYNTRPTLSGESYGTLNIPALSHADSQGVSVDITTLYNGWKNGTIPNYGIGFTRLASTWSGCSWYQYVASSDHSNASLRPKLVIQGVCTPSKNCADQGGIICNSPNICSQLFVSANDTSYCCPSGATCNAPACGDGIINQVSEQCDGTDFGGATCASVLGQGYIGNLACNNLCGIDTSGCYFQACPSGMVSYWNFDEGTGTTAADSVDNNPGTLINGPVWTTGKVGGALSFDGVNDYLTLGSSSAFNFERTNPFSVSLWVKADANVAAWSSLISKMVVGGTWTGWIVELDPNYKISFALVSSWSSNVLRQVSTGQAINDNLWHHVVATYDGSSSPSGMKIYVDGIPQSTNNDFNSLSASIQNSVLPQISGRNGLNSLFKGLIDEPAIYNRALSADEIQQQYQDGLAGDGYCIEPVCDNGIVESGEQCDEGIEDLGNNNCIFNQIGKKCDPVTCQIQEVNSIVETCNNKDDDCEGAIDEGVTRICGDGWTGICTFGFETCSYGEWAGCTAQFPRAEDCNYLDDDCNGFADEGLTSRSCGTDTGECISASQLCANGAWSQCDNTGPIPELCDNKDNNCDGTTDNFFGPDDCPIGQIAGCTNGEWGICQFVTGNITDNCDGLDNDNDGQIDEDFASTTCSASGIGECSEGVTVCNNASGVICTGEGPAPEICDGLDNDCDNQIDESLQRACTTSGMAVGAQRCINADWGPCDPINHAPEICDNLDNDWNGLVDDNLIVSCYLGSNGTEGVGVCKSGLRSCTSGAWGGCLGQVLPSTEICDGLDNDCDGLIDEDLTRSTNELGECSINTETCSAGVWISNNEYSPVTDNNCDDIDQDCNGVNDNDYAPTPTSCGIGECAAVGNLICQAGLQTDTCTAGTPIAEVCDTKDNNCNGIPDDKDTDADGFNDCTVDKCTSLQLPNPPAAFIELKNNHYSLSTQLGYGCTCEEVLYCKPGEDDGEFKFGCSEGTKKVWEAQSQDSWAPECQQNGVVVAPGISKSFFENTDRDMLLDIIDSDNDNDGLSDSVDDMIEDKDPIGDSDHGVPDWHPKSKYKK